MSHTIYYFSGTGNSLHIAQTLSRAVPAEIHAIGNLDLTKPVSCGSSTVGIVFPVYFMNKPEIITRFLERLETAKDAYVYCVTSCGAMRGKHPRKHRPSAG